MADVMLGRLARYLRLLGHDTAYERDITDAALLLLALKEGRILLTRDTGLAARKVLPRGRTFLVLSDDPARQLKEVIDHFSLGPPPPEGLIGRCTVCNSPLARVGVRQSVRDLVPEHVFLSGKDFFRCSGCGRVYWEGSHIERFMKDMRRLLKDG
ncbi:MAG: Mut7-C RNAse domain-containing protein [Nitrospiraceae bacterium]|nr:Mut7-C RNAse domain-containing protein [Nitrospiraceae bacterium]